MGTAVIASLAVTMLWIAVHLVLIRLVAARRRFQAMIRDFLLSLPVLVVAVGWLGGQPALVTALNGQESPWLPWIIAPLTHLLLFFLFVECFYHVERSITLRFLLEIDHAVDRKPSPEKITAEYHVDDMISRRLADMAANGWITREGERWRLSLQGRRLAALMRLSCWIFQSKPQNERI
jgi:hypothetical protein